MSENIRRFSLFPKTLKVSVEQTVKPIYKKHGFAEHRLLTEWATITGPAMAAYSIPQKLTFPAGKKQGGTLHILVAAGRALELQHMQPLILDKIATFFGYPAVARLAFVQSMKPLFAKEKPVAEPVRATPSPELQSAVAACEDDELRAALLSLGTALAAVEN